MQRYRIYVVDGSNHITHAFDYEGTDDLAALEKAKTYMHGDAVEVWQQTRLVVRVAKSGETIQAVA